MSTDKDFKRTSLPEYTTTESTHKRQKLATALEGILPNSSLNGVIKGTHTGTNIRHLHPNKLPKSPVEVGSQYGGITSDDNKQHLFESLIPTEEKSKKSKTQCQFDCPSCCKQMQCRET